MSFTRSVLKLAGTVFFFSVTLLPFAHAQSGGRPAGPPPEAFEACSNLSAGDACSFTGRRSDEITGTCETSPREESLICVPEGGPQGKKGRPE